MAASHSGIVSLADASHEVLAKVLELNQLNVVELSALDMARLKQLIAQAFRAAVIGDGAGFLLAFDQDAHYDSPNFQWFRSRHSRFVYVDRIAIAAACRGQGLANLLYEDLFEAAAGAGHSIIACEVNVDPPNPASDSFHQALGFREVGRASFTNGKTVRYLVKQIS